MRRRRPCSLTIFREDELAAAHSYFPAMRRRAAILAADVAATSSAPINAHSSERSSPLTRRWREQDSNPRSPARETTLRDCLLIAKVRFAADSPLEGDGFEPSVPRGRDNA